MTLMGRSNKNCLLNVAARIVDSQLSPSLTTQGYLYEDCTLLRSSIVLTFVDSSTDPAQDKTSGQPSSLAADHETGALPLLQEIWQGCWQPCSWTPASLIRLASVF